MYPWFTDRWSGVELWVVCPVCRMFLNWVCIVVCRVDGQWPVEKEGLARRGIVRELLCLLGGGIGCGIARKGLTCSPV